MPAVAAGSDESKSDGPLGSPSVKRTGQAESKDQSLLTGVRARARARVEVCNNVNSLTRTFS